MSASTRIRITLVALIKLLCVIAVFGFGVLLASITSAQMDDDGSCVYNRSVYPDGAQLCQGGQLMECDEGAWADIGECDDPRPEPAPISGGGDVERN